MPKVIVVLNTEQIANLVMHLHAFPEDTLRFLESKNQLLGLIKYIIKDDGIIAEEIHQKIAEQLIVKTRS